MKQMMFNLMIALVSFMSPIFPLFSLVSILIATDFCFGLYRAYRTKQIISSRKMGHTISKIFLYNLGVLSVYMMENFILGTSPQYTKIVVGVVAMVELKSIDESFKIIYGFSIYDSFINKLKRGVSQTKSFDEKTK